MAKKISRLEVFFLLTLLAVSLLRFLDLGGGVVPAEPDEVLHEELVEGFKSGGWPKFSGGEWYYNLPLFPFLGYLFSFFLTGRFRALRVVSLLATALLALAVYLYATSKSQAAAGFFGALFFLLTPFSVFYSRLGLIEPLAVSLGFLFLFSFDRAVSQRRKLWALLGGLFLGLALLSKYSSLVFLLLLVFVFLLRSLRRTLAARGKQAILLDIYSFCALAVAVLMVLPIAFVLYRHNPYLFKAHLFVSLGLSRAAATWSLDSFFVQLRRIPFWLSWPVATLFPFGLLDIAGRRRREWRLFLSAFFLSFAVVLARAPFYPRYFFLLVPFFSVAAGLGLDHLVAAVQRFGLLNRWVAAFLFFLLLVPSFFTAWRATKHRLVEEAGRYIRDRSEEEPWLFSNYWPHFFGRAAGTKKASWLAGDAAGVRAFVPEESRDALTILRQEGGFVVIEEIFSAFLVQSPARIKARDFIEKNYRPEKVIEETAPSFPYFAGETNKVSIYRIEAGT